MLDLKDKVALVAGGAGHVGEGIVRAFIARGARVAVPSRDAGHLSELRQRLGNPPLERLLTLVGEISKPEDAVRLRDAAEKALGPLDAVVASVGGWWQGSPLTEVSLETWREILDRNLTSHFVMARALLPSLAKREGSSYTLINGTAAEEPVARAGLSSIAAAAQAMMGRVLIEEHRQFPVRINVLVMGSIQTRRVSEPHPDWLTPDDVGSFCAFLASAEGRMVSGTLQHLLSKPARH